ncbi:YdeI/OmpD-associated family protein [Bacillus marasmi]|uniref:YdeI/OmpD-associated family protein n=1 Tax=Bacillus marasmi TaxID=1926279 RepID=UPI0011CA2F9D|nr:YdeI/OmpD-associated family protein [Bacillus marasmi]
MSIATKLKLEKYNNLTIINQPEDYDILPGRANSLSQGHDCIFIFIENIDEMVSYTQQIINNDKLLNEKGYLFFAYPKKGNKRYDSYIHRDEIFPAMKVNEDDGYVGNSDIKFSRMVGLDDVFTVVGLKREKKKAKKSTAASQCVEDYIDNFKDVEAFLGDHPNTLAIFNELTPGYQRDWARYIYSAKQQATRDKRQQQMIEVLEQGYKTMDLYRLKKK